MRHALKFLALCLILSVVSSACAEVDSITFLGIDWYVTQEQFEEGLVKAGINAVISSQTEYENLVLRFDNSIPYDDIHGKYKIQQKIIRYESPYKKYGISVPYNVAGYNVRIFEATFLPRRDNDSIVLNDPDLLFKVVYTDFTC